MILHGPAFAKRILAALGVPLDVHARRITIECRVDEPVTLTIECLNIPEQAILDAAPDMCVEWKQAEAPNAPGDIPQ